MATLLAALFFCLGSGPGSHHEPAGAHTGARAAGNAAAPTSTVTGAAPVVGEVAVEYVCPYDRGGCSLFPSLSPAVLSAPPLDPPPHAAGGPPRLDPPSGDGQARRSGARPRAPDLHVLQVLRT